MRGIGDRVGRLWSRDSEVANEISGRGTRSGDGSRWRPLNAGRSSLRETGRLEILVRKLGIAVVTCAVYFTVLERFEVVWMKNFIALMRMIQLARLILCISNTKIIRLVSRN